MSSGNVAPQFMGVLISLAGCCHDVRMLDSYTFSLSKRHAAHLALKEGVLVAAVEAAHVAESPRGQGDPALLASSVGEVGQGGMLVEGPVGGDPQAPVLVGPPVFAVQLGQRCFGPLGRPSEFGDKPRQGVAVLVDAVHRHGPGESVLLQHRHWSAAWRGVAAVGVEPFHLLSVRSPELEVRWRSVPGNCGPD